MGYPRSIEEQINRLKCKGMHFSDVNRAYDSLLHISYFRLKYYWKDMLDPETDDDFLTVASWIMSRLMGRTPMPG